MPQGRGRKGGSCPRKRKAPETIETRVTYPFFTLCNDNSSSEQGNEMQVFLVAKICHPSQISSQWVKVDQTHNPQLS